MSDSMSPEVQSFVSQQVEEKVEASLAEILSHANFPEITALLARHDSVLYGNGRPGLVALQAKYEERQETMGKSLKDIEDQLDKVMAFQEKISKGIYAASAVITAFGLLGSALVWIFLHWNHLTLLFGGITPR